MVWVLNPCIGIRILSSPKHPNWLWGPPSTLCNHYWDSFPWLKQPGCEIAHSSASSVSIKSEWSCTSVPTNTLLAWTGKTLPLLKYVVGCLEGNASLQVSHASSAFLKQYFSQCVHCSLSFLLPSRMAW
jgi:hypothetical protein